MTGGARRGAAVLGSPIAHSLSPVLHTAAYDALDLDGWTYRAVECDEAALPSTLQRLEAEGLAGVSLTMPLKRAVLPLLARTDRIAADVGAANTVLFGGIEGEWWGANTDVPGMLAALRAAGVTAAASACVLGAGATASSALAALRDLGVAAVVVCARRPDAADDLRRVAAVLGIEVDVRRWADAAAVAGAVDVVVATTPAGTTDELAEALADALATAPAGLLFDVVYSPWPTRLAATWSRIGGRVVGGLELLVEQAALQVQLMTGRDAPIGVMRAAGVAALSGR